MRVSQLLTDASPRNCGKARIAATNVFCSRSSTSSRRPVRRMNRFSSAGAWTRSTVSWAARSPRTQRAMSSGLGSATALRTVTAGDTAEIVAPPPAAVEEIRSEHEESQRELSLAAKTPKIGDRHPVHVEFLSDGHPLGAKLRPEANTRTDL